MSSSTKSQRSNGREQKDEKEKTGPIFTRRVWTGTGSVEVAVFDKMIEDDGQEFRVFNVVAKRTWKKDDKYESGNSFRPEDLLPLAVFLQEAYSFIANEQAKR